MHTKIVGVEHDLKLTGNVTWVGTSSIEVAMSVKMVIVFPGFSYFYFSVEGKVCGGGGEGEGGGRWGVFRWGLLY